MEHKISALILMGGKGERFGSSRPKQLHLLSGKPVFIHTLEAFLKADLFHEIILVSPEEWIEEIRSYLEKTPTSTPIKIINGGESRRSSSYLGLKAVDLQTTHVVIHDAVRPFVSQRIIQENVLNAIDFGAVDTCIPSADTIVHSIEGGIISDIPPRNQYLRGQTPQSFKLDLILEAHEKAMQDGFTAATDDCSLVTRLKAPIHIVMGDESNIKITTELDLFIAEQILRLPQEASHISHEGSLIGKVFVVTGGTGGIGSAIIKALETKGATVLSVSRSAKEFIADLSDPAQVERVFNEIHETYGPIDSLVNSVGSLKLQAFHTLTANAIEELISVNLSSLIFCCRYAKIKRNGHILNIASSSYSKGRKNYAVYSATKAAVVNFTQGLAEEMPHHFVNVLAPQRTLTPLRLLHFPEDSVDMLMPVEQVAQTALEILTSGKLTGTIIEVRKKEASSVQPIISS